MNKLADAPSEHHQLFDTYNWWELMFSNGYETVKQRETKLNEIQRYNNCIKKLNISSNEKWSFSQTNLTRIEKQDTDDEKQNNGVVVTFVLLCDILDMHVYFDGCW